MTEHRHIWINGICAICRASQWTLEVAPTTVVSAAGLNVQ